MTGRYP